MYFDRKRYKLAGSAAFRHNYWYSVLAALVLAFATGNLFFRFNFSSTRGYNPGVDAAAAFEPIFNDMVYELSENWLAIASVLFVAVLVASIVFLCLRIFLLNPLALGGARFFVSNALTPAKPGELGCGFNSNRYLRNVGIMFFRDLYLWLWSLLFFIPAIIKYYEYFFVPYLAVAHPEMDRRTVFAASKAMTDGHKFDIFVMQLSFLGWDILSTITGGLGGIFYVNPYKQASYAEMYWDLARQIGL